MVNFLLEKKEHLQGTFWRFEEGGGEGRQMGPIFADEANFTFPHDPDPFDPEEAAIVALRKEVLDKFLATCTKRERKILEQNMYKLNPEFFLEMDISRQRAQQILTGLKSQLRTYAAKMGHVSGAGSPGLFGDEDATYDSRVRAKPRVEVHDVASDYLEQDPLSAVNLDSTDVGQVRIGAEGEGHLVDNEAGSRRNWFNIFKEYIRELSESLNRR